MGASGHPGGGCSGHEGTVQWTGLGGRLTSRLFSVVPEQQTWGPRLKGTARAWGRPELGGRAWPRLPGPQRLLWLRGCFAHRAAVHTERGRVFTREEAGGLSWARTRASSSLCPLCPSSRPRAQGCRSPLCTGGSGAPPHSRGRWCPPAARHRDRCRQCRWQGRPQVRGGAGCGVGNAPSAVQPWWDRL